jgi:hypothetical protein
MEAPATAMGTGPQLMALQASAPSPQGPRNLQAVLSVDGRWWCLRSVAADSGEEPRLPAQRAGPRRGDAAELLRRIAPKLPGTEAQSTAAGAITVQVVPPGGARTTLPTAAAAAALARFGREMRRTSPACAWP